MWLLTARVVAQADVHPYQRPSSSLFPDIDQGRENHMSSYLTEALVYERIDRYQTEAANHRRARPGRPQGPGAIERMIKAFDSGLAAISEPLRVDRRPRIPAI
jgi:hypothetical protein